MNEFKLITEFKNWKEFQQSEFCPRKFMYVDANEYAEGLYNFLMVEAPDCNLYKLSLDECYPYWCIEDIMHEYGFQTTDEVYENFVVFLIGYCDRLILIKNPLAEQLCLGNTYDLRYNAKWSHSYR